MTTEQLIEQIQNGTYSIPEVTEQDWFEASTIENWKAELEVKKTELEDLETELTDEGGEPLPDRKDLVCTIICLVQYVICMMAANQWPDQVMCQAIRDNCLRSCGTVE